jgi:Raf kinase inhibitor-like YbhB/YbcL family protein
MIRRLAGLGAVLALSIALATAASAKGGKIVVTSPDFKANGKINDEQVFKGFGCNGGNVSPALSWSGLPAGTKSVALTMYDPDAPTGSGFWHWVVFNLPPSTTGLAKGAGDPKGTGMPAGAVQSRTDFGTPGYGGPCPPPGKPHHYIFTVFAVDTDKLDGNADTSAAIIGFMLHFHTLAKGKVVGLYGRSK